MQHMESNADLQRGGAHADDSLAGLADYRMQELLLHEVLPRLGPAALAHLRATCRSLESLLDSELCSESWYTAAKRILPGCQHVPARDRKNRDDTSARVLDPSGKPSQISQKLQHQQADLPGTSMVAQDPQQTRSGHACLLPTNSAKKSSWLLDKHAVRVQQLLRHKSTLLKRLAQPARISCFTVKPRQDTTKGRELWSPCGTWLAMQQYDEEVVEGHSCKWQLFKSDAAPPGYHVSQACSLMVGNMTTMRACRLCSIPKGSFLALAWLPGSSWLVWAKSHNIDDGTSGQSIFCLDVATGKRHQRMDKPWRVNWLQHAPCIFATARVMACAEEDQVQLLRLPSLKPMASFADSWHKGAYVAAVSLDSSGAYIAICWGHNAFQPCGIPPDFWDFDEFLQEPKSPDLSCAFRLSVFHVPTMKRQFQLYSASKPRCSWSPVKSRLLIASDCIRILDAEAGTYVRVAIEPSECSRIAGAWTLEGGMAVMRGRQIGSGDQRQPSEACFVILANGIIFATIRSQAGGPILTDIDGDIVINPPACLLDMVRLYPAYGGYLFKDIQNILRACQHPPRPHSWEFYSQLGGHCVVAPPLCRTNSGPIKLIQLDIDFATRSASSHLVPCNPVPQSSTPVWYPLQEACGVYALIGEDYDVWVVDGQHHRLLQHWEGRKLMRSETCVSAGKPMPQTWHRISWSSDGTKLLLVSSNIVTAIDFGFPLSASPALPLRPPVRENDRSRGILKRFFGEEVEEEISCLDY